MIKNILILFFLIIIFTLIGKNANASLIYNSAYWSGCVQGMVKVKGQSHGKNSEYCKELAKKKKFEQADFQKVNKTMEEARGFFFEGCSHSEADAETCHQLTKIYHKDLEDIINQEPQIKSKNEK